MKKNKDRNSKSGASSPAKDSQAETMAQLRSIIQEDMQRRDKKTTSGSPQSPPEATARKAQKNASNANKSQPKAPPSTTENVKTMSENASKAADAGKTESTAKAPDFSLLTSKILQIAARSHKLLNSFFDRNKTLIGKMPNMDPGHVGKAFTDFTGKMLANPEKFVESQIAFWQDYVKLLQGALAASSGKKMPTVIEPSNGDKRFKDASWQEVWVFDFIKQSYLLMSKWAEGLVDHIEGLDPKVAHKVTFYTHQMIDAMSPTNFWMTNPEVLRTTIETRGENLIKGLENLLADIEKGHGQLMISMSDNSVFKFGENIATSKGKVVFQNDLIQLIQFSPLTEQVHKTPMLIIPPWINKYYILDLKEENSYIRYIIEQGYTVFCISWVNPDIRHAKLSFEDYMMLGPVAAATEVAKITGEKQVNCTGYCIGGTLLACMMGWLAGIGDKKPAGMPEVASTTYLVTMIDFEEPGDLGVFIDEDQVQLVESMMAEKGFLSGSTMGTTFAMLRANDLIWSFVVNNYLMGKEPFPFDLLTWNSDSTNLPAAMQSYYLRNMYMHNKLIKPGALSMKGVPIDLTKVTVPAFCLSTHDDHITPWRSTYAAARTYSGPVTFCLSGSGHIAGVVNPPAKKKYGHWINNNNGLNNPADPNEWFKAAVKQEGSWWPEWIKWLHQHSGSMVPARDPASNQNVIEDAPGSYVRVKAL
jgi:polyhydroxyalkanoate synthase subunit PhaC